MSATVLNEARFEQVAAGRAFARAPVPTRPELLHARCQHRHNFYAIRGERPPLVLAVFHERMDLMASLHANPLHRIGWRQPSIAPVSTKGEHP